MKINPEEFVAFPKETVVAFVPAETPLDQVAESLEEGGISADQIAVYQ